MPTPSGSATPVRKPTRRTTLPPTYTGSEPAPTYTVTASEEEIVLDGGRVKRRYDPANHHIVCNYSRRAFAFSVTFERQRNPNDPFPMYQQGEAVSGFVTLLDRSGYEVVDVTVELEGNIDITSEHAGQRNRTFIQVSDVLWKQPENDSDAPVPDRIEFSLDLPRTIVEPDGTERALPSSLWFENNAGLSASLHYSANIIINLRKYAGLVTKNRKLETPFNYIHRQQPPSAPLGSDESFLSTVKVAPEEWGTVTLDVPLKDSQSSLCCTVALPASKIFHVGDSIPIHVQLSGSATGLIQFVDTIAPPSSSAASVATFGTLGQVTSRGTAYMTVRLERRILANISGSKVVRFLRLSSDAQLSFSGTPATSIQSGLLAWNGTLQPKVTDAWAPECRLAELTTTDVMIIEVCKKRLPQSVEASGGGSTVTPQKLTVPIKLVTEPFQM